MGSETIQARFGEDTYPIGRFVLDRARALGISRTELVRRLGYRDVGNGHKALKELLTTGTVPPLIAQHLADALELDEELVASVMAATARQQQDEASQRALARETAYRTAFQPHLRCETERAIPEPLFVAALLTSGRLRLVPVCSETWLVGAGERDRQLKAAIQGHYREHRGHVPSFGAIVGYTAILTPGYLIDFGLPYDLDGDPVGPMRPVERLQEAVLGTKRGDSRLTGLLRDTPIGILA
jgi:hypothetical protein